ncbi:MAG: VanZ family protein [Luteimonas sp.]
MDDELRTTDMQPSAAGSRILGWWLLGLSVVLVLVVMALPPQTMAWMRADYRWLGRPLNWLEMLSPHIDLDHVVLFGWIGFATCLAWRGAHGWRLLPGLAGLAVASELMQFAVPGRTPRLTDARDDLLGAVVGWGLALLLVWVVRWMSRRQA